MARYFAALVMLAAGCVGLVAGGPWTWTGVGVFIVAALCDALARPDLGRRRIERGWRRQLALYLPLLALVALWALYARLLAQGSVTLPSLAGAMLSVAFLSALGGLPPAHELMHQAGRLPRLVASLYLTIFLLPMNDLGHVSGHHLRVATADDYDTPRRGEKVYGFAFRSLWRQMLDSFALESARLAKLRLRWWMPGSRYLQASVTTLAWLGGWFALAGASALPVYVLTMVVFYLVLGGFNYTQHYGLIRVPGQPIEPRHAWNQLQPLSRSLSFEISNHSGHHLEPARPYTELEPFPDAARMPSIILCFVCAFVPPLWERLIARPRLASWDASLASADERILAREANRRAGWGTDGVLAVDE